MSLKMFHIIFISLSVLMSILFAGWCWNAYFYEQSFFYMAGGIISLLIASGLIFYGKWFLKKYKGLSNI